MANQINIQPAIPEGPRDQVIEEIVDAIRNQLTQEFAVDDILSDNIITVTNDLAGG